MKIIAVIGAGTMGNGIAHTFAQSGFTVKLIDVSEKALGKGMTTIFTNLNRMVAKGTISEEDKFKTLNNIITYTDIEDGVVGVDLVIEVASENLELKLNIFKKLNEVCSHSTIFATQTNFIDSISKIIAHPERLIVLDFIFESDFNSKTEINPIIINLTQKMDKSALEYYGFGEKYN
jgi:3-hydroxybutyryl-CoA dehydrogenase